MSEQAGALGPGRVALRRTHERDLRGAQLRRAAEVPSTRRGRRVALRRRSAQVAEGRVACWFAEDDKAGRPDGGYDPQRASCGLYPLTATAEPDRGLAAGPLDIGEGVSGLAGGHGPHDRLCYRAL